MPVHPGPDMSGGLASSRAILSEFECSASTFWLSRGFPTRRGRVRYTFGTHLSASGVHLRTAMAALRHSRVGLTTDYYTDPVLLDAAGAMNLLPDLSSGQGDTNGRTAKGA